MTTQETLIKYLSDMYSLEEHLAQPLKSQAKDDDFTPFPQAKALVQRALTRTEIAMSDLERVTKSLGGSTGGVKSTISAVAGAAASIVNEGRTHAITKKLRDDQTALSLVSTGYTLLHATANALGSTEVATLAKTKLHEVAKIVMDLSQEIIPVAVKELSETNEVDMSTVAASQQNVQQAWSY